MGKSLDDDLNESRLTRYNKIEPEIKHYLFTILSPHYQSLFAKYSTPSQPYDSLSLMHLLHDGEVLCRLGQLVEMPNKNPTLNFKSSSMAFIQMENISWFLKLCEIINLPQDEIFQTVDLFESKDPYQVCITLMSFSRIVHEMNPQTFTMVIGPKRVRKKPVIPNKPRALRS